MSTGFSMQAFDSHYPLNGSDIHFPQVYDEDVLNQKDTISLEELGEHLTDPAKIAGFNEATPVDTFMNLNGETAFITGDGDYD